MSDALTKKDFLIFSVGTLITGAILTWAIIKANR